MKVIYKDFIIILCTPEIQKYSDRRFVNIENGSQSGSHWTCFIVKYNKSFYYDSFGGAPDKFLLNQLPKPIIYQIYKIQDTNSKLCGS